MMQGARRLDGHDRRARRAAHQERALAGRPLAAATSRRSRCWPGSVRARRDGVGCDCDISLFETALSLLTYVGTWAATAGSCRARMADSAHPSIVPFQAFPAARRLDRGRLRQGEVLAALCAASAGRSSPTTSASATSPPATATATSCCAILRSSSPSGRSAEWLALLAAAGVPAAPVHDVAEALDRPAGRGPRDGGHDESPGAGRGAPASPRPCDLSGEPTPVRACSAPAASTPRSRARRALGYDERVEELAASGRSAPSERRRERDGAEGVARPLLRGLRVGDVFRSRLGRTDHRDRQRLVHGLTHEHEPGALRRGVRRAGRASAQRSSTRA